MLSSRYQHRQLIVISGELEDCVQAAKTFTAELSCLWLSDNEIESVNVLTVNKATTVLGQEFEVVIIDAHDKAFNANAFGAVVGTIVGGGCLVLLTPSFSEWVKESRFITRFVRLLKNTTAQCYTPENLPRFKRRAKLSELTKLEFVYSEEQAAVFGNMLRVVEGHRRRPLVLTSDRGRGKSTLLGKLAAHLLMQQCSKIIVTAPSKRIAATLFESAKTALGENEDLLAGLQFLSPDELHQQKPKADLVLVDEAASIPIPLLSDFIQQHSRIIFATTEHGYEGSGRGFGIRFRKVLDKVCPKWQNVRLETPYRWAIDDPLEQFTFDALLLNADVEASNITDINFQQCEMQRVSRDELLADESMLRTIFGLLVSAHYQTRPSDLLRLLDEDNYHVFIMTYQNQLIATTLTSEEGGFSESLASDVFNGVRRPQGHIVPQTLATHAGLKDAPILMCDRVMRIAVHPELQGSGIGSYFLKCLIADSKVKKRVDYLSTSFGATPELLSFWYKAGFTIAHIGMKRDASSGTHSVVMLKPLNVSAEILCNKAKEGFENSFPLLLSDPLRHLETSVIAILFAQFKESKLELDDAEKQLLIGFCEHHRGYESSIVAINKLVLSGLTQAFDLEDKELQLVIAKVLQKQAWSSLVALTGVSGQKQAVKLLRQAVSKFVYPSLMSK